MFKKTLVLLCLLLLAFQANASIYLIEPISQKLSDDEEIAFGRVAAGETLRIIVKKKSDLSLEWDRLSVNQSSLPSGWEAKPETADKTLIASIKVSKNARESTQRIKLNASNSMEPGLSETFFATVFVKENLLSVAIENPSQDAVLGQKTGFNMTLSNESIAGHSVKIESSLPEYWFSSREVQLNPFETKTVSLEVLPYSYGEKAFSFSVSSLENEKQFSFPVRMNTRPTLSGIFKAPAAGFPFFTVTILPFYLINSLLSILG